MFKVRRLIKVGSFYETTKIGDPDEFDFLVELEGDCNVKIECTDNPCSAHVKASDVDVTDHGMVLDGNLSSSRIFFAFRDHIKHNLSRGMNEKNELTILRCRTGQLSIFPALHEMGPNVEIHLKWSKYVDGEKNCMDLFGISMDISVCIDCPAEILSAWSSLIDRKLLDDLFSETDETRVDSLMQSQDPSLGIDESSTTAQHYVPKPVLVVPSSSRLGPCRYGKSLYEDYTCWRISFAPVEVYCMKKLPKHHRICYCILKLICKQRENVTTKGLGPEPALRSLSSYMLKNAVLAHNTACKGDLNETTCLEAIVDYLLKCAEKAFLPAFFFPKLTCGKQ